METKICTKCGEEKPATFEFWAKDKTVKSGLRCQCKKCSNTQIRNWRNNNPEKVRESTRSWLKNNPKKARESKLKWHKNNPEKMRESSLKWRKNNSEKARKNSFKWRKNNSEKARESSFISRRKNPKKVCETQTKYDQKQRSNMGTNYITGLLKRQFNLKTCEITPLDIEEKREQIQYYRQIQCLTKKIKQNETINS